MYESLSLLSGLAARTSRIRIGTAVLQLAMREPVVSAKAIASIDRLSGGRLTVGVGIGGEFPPEWEAVGVRLRTRARRTDEMLEALAGLWGTGAYRFSGKTIDIPEIDLQPKPMQDPLPVWVGGRSEASVERAAKRGTGWMGIFLTPERYGERVAALKVEAERAGRDPESLATSLYVWTCVAPSDAEARATAETLLGLFYNVAFERLERYAVVGSPERCAARLAEYAAAGCGHFAVAPILPTPSTEPVGWIKELTGLVTAT